MYGSATVNNAVLIKRQQCPGKASNRGPVLCGLIAAFDLFGLKAATAPHKDACGSE